LTSFHTPLNTLGEHCFCYYYYYYADFYLTLWVCVNQPLPSSLPWCLSSFHYLASDFYCISFYSRTARILIVACFASVITISLLALIIYCPFNFVTSLPGINLRRNTPVTNTKDFSQTVARINEE